MNIFDNLFLDFKISNYIQWIKEIKLAFTQPRKFILTIKKKTNSKLFSQFLFYALVYTLAFLLLSIDLSFTEAFRPAAVAAFDSIFIIIILSISSFIATKKLYLRSILILILSYTFFITPILFLLFTEFLYNEDYLYKIILNIIATATSLFIVFGWAFIIETNFKIAIKIFLVSYLLSNSLWFVKRNWNFDNYSSKKDITNSDPIFNEYASVVSGLAYKDTIPVSRAVTIIKGKIFTTFLTKNPFNTSLATATTIFNKKYVSSIKMNITTLTKAIDNAKYLRNKNAFYLWKLYYEKILLDAEFKINDLDELQTLIKEQKVTPINADSLWTNYIFPANYASIISVDMSLKPIHNNMINIQKQLEVPETIQYRSEFFLGYVVDYCLYKVFDNGKKTPYNDTFLPIE